MRTPSVGIAIGVGSVLLSCSGEGVVSEVVFEVPTAAAMPAEADLEPGGGGDAAMWVSTSPAPAGEGESCEALGMPPGTIPSAGEWNACPPRRGGREHAALDFTSRKGTAITAGTAGTIQYLRQQRAPRCFVAGEGCSPACLASGDFLVLKAACGDPRRPGNEVFVRYFHIAGVRRGLKVGDRVARGEIIAYVGDSGCATGAHVHLEAASFSAGKYALGTPPPFGDCASTLNPASAFARVELAGVVPSGSALRPDSR